MIRCRITCHDFDRIIDMLDSLTRVIVGNDTYSVPERSIDITCQEEDLDAVRKVVTRFDRHARIEIWRPKGEPPPILLAKESPSTQGTAFVFVVRDPPSKTDGPLIETYGKRPEA